MLRILFYITLLFLPEILLAGGSSGATATFPTSLDAYGDGDFSAQGKGIGDILLHRISFSIPLWRDRSGPRRNTCTTNTNR
jgi:hypothetical protein